MQREGQERRIPGPDASTVLVKRKEVGVRGSDSEKKTCLRKILIGERRLRGGECWERSRIEGRTF